MLCLTTRLVSDPVRRVTETAQFLCDVTAPNGLAPGVGPGYDAARRVRLMHAAVRYLADHDPAFVDEERRDQPGGAPAPAVNQEDLLGVLMTFTTVVFGCLRRQGIGYTRQDAESFLHLFCVVGDLLGLRRDLLPLTLDEAEALTPRLFGRLQRPSDDGAVLTAAVAVDAIAATVRYRALHGLPASSMRWYVGDEIATMLRLPRKDWTWLLFGPFHSFMRWLGREEQHASLVRSLNRRLDCRRASQDGGNRAR